jgi:hypothetical protein
MLLSSSWFVVVVTLVRDHVACFDGAVIVFAAVIRAILRGHEFCYFFLTNQN